MKIKIIGEAKPEDDGFDIYPENQAAWLAFLKINRCWRYAPMGGILGLDWQQASSRLSLIGVTLCVEDADKIDVIADGVISALQSQ